VIVTAAAGASGPITLKVTRSTVLHGDAASLTAADGNTLDIRADPNTRNVYGMRFRASYGQRPAGQVTVRLTAWTNPDLYGYCTAEGPGSSHSPQYNDFEFSLGLDHGSASYVYTLPTAQEFVLRVHCHTLKPGHPFTAYWDQLATDP
jgi:hypothetical protein